MGQRPKTKQAFTEDAANYQYKGDLNAGIRPHEECEMEQDAHRVKPKTWPPVRLGNQQGEPYIDARCIDCGAWLQVYAGHATGQIKGVEIILPQEPVVTQQAINASGGPRIGRPRKDAVPA